MPNQLANSTSPYLLQHADNPVNWYPWGEAAFELARRENKPVFLSIGYSTCHWCHVMAHESFENPEVAAVMNEFFVNIKVDREERPDIDRLYMAFVQATTGSGGWPMSVWLTPDGQPFFGGTYFPPTDRFGRTGFVTVLERIAEVWAREQQRVVEQGRQVIEALREGSTPAPSTQPLNTAPMEKALEGFKRSYDPHHGGFGGGPKFPRPSVFDFLLCMDARDTSGVPTQALEMTLHTLRRMVAGGINDHLGGGFHRYSVDGQWHVPHFEKMLYDQAQIVCSLIDAWSLTQDTTFSDATRDTLGYVSRCLTHPEGGFYSAEDADSLFEHGRPEHGEGAFYVWTMEEIVRLLGSDASPIFCRHYGVEPEGNAPEGSDPQGEFKGKNILIQRESISATAEYLKLDPATVRDSLAASRALLAMAREKRPRPHLDDKILAAWNGLMISAFARAGGALADGNYLEAAKNAARFLRNHLVDPNTGRLVRSWRNGTPSTTAFAEDYAFLIQGLLDLYEASFEPEWLEWAWALQKTQDELFFDEPTGTYLGSVEGDPLVPLRLREDYDGAEPSANSVSAINLQRFAWMLHDNACAERATRVIRSFESILQGMPTAIPKMLCALDMHLSAPRQFVIAGARSAADTEALAHAVRRKFIPHRVLVFAEDTPDTRAMKPVDGRAALYICENFACQAPVTEFA